MPGFCQTTIGLALVMVATATPKAPADPLTICDVQYTTEPDGSSPYDNQVIDCAGGIVVGKYEGTRPRIFLIDPNCPSETLDADCPAGWGGIQVKDWTWPYELYDGVQAGDWVALTNVRVEEHVGVTFLQYEPWEYAGYTRTPGYALPAPKIVSVSEMPAPLEYPGDEWHVENHDAECYESMRRTSELGRGELLGGGLHERRQAVVGKVPPFREHGPALLRSDRSLRAVHQREV